MVEAARAAGGLLAVSEGLKRDMTGLGIPADKVKVHYTGIDLDRFLPLDRAREKARLGIEGPLIVTPGALIERKGQKLAIEALARLPDATLLMAGDGPDRKALERQAQKLGVAGRARFLGSRPHEEMPRLLAAADVMLLPSRSEGLANVWVEALACGTPVVTCQAGSAGEAIDRPAAGRMVEREPGELAAAVRALLATPPAQDEVRKAALRFSWQRNSEELAAHLRAVALGG